MKIKLLSFFLIVLLFEIYIFIKGGFVQLLISLVLLIILFFFLELGTRIFTHLFEIFILKNYKKGQAIVVDYEEVRGAYGVSRFIPILEINGKRYILSQYRLMHPELVGQQVEIFQSPVNAKKIICLKFNICT